MSSLQQRETFRTSRLLAFASERELTAQIGHRREQWPRVAVKELVDNAIDACEERDIPPEIRVRVAHDLIEVGDNGPGIAEDVVADVLDFAVRVSSRKAYVGSTRGAQGNALKTLVAMPFARDGEHGLVEIESRGVLHRIAFAIDQIAQEPQAERSTKPSLVRNGTVVRIRWPDLASSILTASGSTIHRDLYRFAVFNPHLGLTADLFDERLNFEATDPAWRKWRPGDPLPPQWFDQERNRSKIWTKISSQLISNGATKEEIEFLCYQRVELNAFTSDRLVRWVERKLDAAGVAKVRPEPEMLAKAARHFARGIVLERKAEAWQGEIDEEAGVLDVDGLGEEVGELLARHRTLSWDDVVRRIVRRRLHDKARA